MLYENGYDNISVYDGGWYEWLMHDDYPVQVGDPASADCQHTTVGELPTGKAAKQISQYAVSEKCGLWYSKVYYGNCEKWYCSGDNEE